MGKMKTEIAMKKGTIIICPRCDDRIAKLKHDVFIEDVMLIDDFIWLNQKFSNKDKMDCQKCGAQYGVQSGHMFTTKGWLPKDEDQHKSL